MTLTPAAVLPRVFTPSHECHRVSCRATVPRYGAYCSQTCKRVDLAHRAMPHAPSTGYMTVGADTAVAHALPWLDVRAREAA